MIQLNESIAKLNALDFGKDTLDSGKKKTEK